MRTLILSCSTGQGHDQAALALKETFGDGCDICQALELISKPFSSLICNCHLWIYCHIPSLFNTIYASIETHPKNLSKSSLIYRILALGSDRLADLIVTGGYDTVICTHIFAALMLTEANRRQDLKIKSAFVSTDYTCCPGVKYTDLDYYFIPSEKLISQFVSNNISREKIIPSGIPINQSFYTRQEKHFAKKKLGVPYNHSHIIVMCGSSGCGPIYKLSVYLSSHLPSNCDLTVICGRNLRLKRRLMKKLSGVTNVHIRGYVSDMSLLMDSADVCITKAGGISTTELVNKHIPMILIDVVAGCEEYNRDYFVKNGSAKTAKGIKAISYKAISLLTNDVERQRMKTSMFKISGVNSAKIIYSVMEGVYYETTCY